MLALKNPNALLTLDIDGRKNELALAKHVQRHPLKGVIEHVDLILVRRGEKVVVDIPVHVVGEAVPGTLVNLEHPTISLKAEATHLPEYVEVSVEGLEAGTLIHASDLTLPSGSELDADPEVLVVNVNVAPTAEDLEAAPAEAEAEVEEGAEAAEGEGAEAAEAGPAEAEGASEES
jgi:large subunit ribosomal protein L25